MSDRFNEYASYIIKSINLRQNQSVEIVTPNECVYFAERLLKELLSYTHDIYLTITNSKREDNPHLDDSFYDRMIEKEFVRITITSPFTLSRDNYYLDLQTPKLKDYFHKNISQRTMVAIPNNKWASNLGITLGELLDKIINIALRENKLSKYIDKLYDLDIRYLHIKTGIGTDLLIETIKGFKFNTGILKTKKGIEFKANIPSLEIYTSPNKHGVIGKIVGSKPIYIKDRLIGSFQLEFEEGKVIKSIGLDSVLRLDDSMYYLGEIGLAEYDNEVFCSTIIDENLSTHIALGNSYRFGIPSKYYNDLNYSEYHVDLPIGTNDMLVEAKDKEGNIVTIFKDGNFIFE